MLASAVSIWQQVFPGCACVPPAPEAAVPLVFSSYSHDVPEGAGSLKAAYSSSYTAANERLTREQLKQKYKDHFAGAKAGGAVREETPVW
jgi:hypothetical protein